MVNMKHASMTDKLRCFTCIFSEGCACDLYSVVGSVWKPSQDELWNILLLYIVRLSGICCCLVF